MTSMAELAQLLEDMAAGRRAVDLGILSGIAGQLKQFEALVVSYSTDADSGCYVQATLSFPVRIISTHIHEVWGLGYEAEFRHEWPVVTTKTPTELRETEKSVEAEIEEINRQEEEGEDDDE